MKIKNINGMSGTTCSCGSWLKHWENFSGRTTLFCQAIACTNRDVVGAHVQKVNGSDNKSYIYPLCNAHHQHTGELVVSDTYELVSANKKETCEK